GLLGQRQSCRSCQHGYCANQHDSHRVTPIHGMFFLSTVQPSFFASPGGLPVKSLPASALPLNCQSSQAVEAIAQSPPCGWVNVPPCPTPLLATKVGSFSMRLKSSMPFAYAMSVSPPRRKKTEACNFAR